jgi:choline dehydrogenase-like flavoprotein
MKIDSINLPGTTLKESYSVCIVGGGFVGLTLARAISKMKNARICVLESGSESFDVGTQDLYRGKTLIYEDNAPKLEKPHYLTKMRLRMLGGSGNHWGGSCFQPDHFDFLNKPWLGDAQRPISFDDLSPHYKIAADILEISEKFKAINQLTVLPENDQFMTKFNFRSPVVYRKDKFKNEIVSPGISPTNITTITRATVTGFKFSRSKNRVTGVKFKNPDMKPFLVNAKIVVLCTGGIENARILLNCRDQSPNGLGNENDLVGRFFNEHLVFQGSFSKASLSLKMKDIQTYIYPKSIEGRWSPNQRLTYKHQLLRTLINLRLTEEKQSIPTVEGKLRGNKHHFFKIVFIAEQKPDFNSRVALDNEKDMYGLNRISLNWGVTDADYKSLHITARLFAKYLGQSLYGKVMWALNPDRHLEFAGGAHHMSTTRMGLTPKTSVVDRNCKLHSLDNFYIGGTSVMPRGSCDHPTYTCIALAVRLAEHIKNNLKT